jgi:hypothetical protein
MPKEFSFLRPQADERLPHVLQQLSLQYNTWEEWRCVLVVTYSPLFNQRFPPFSLAYQLHEWLVE